MQPAMEPSFARIAYTACPLCDAKASTEIRIADCTAHPLYKPALPATLRWVRCEQCTHIHVDGYFGAAACASLFAATNPEQQPGYELESQRLAWSRVVATICRMRASGSGRWLDVGFGSGSLLTTAAEFGHSVVGLDTRSENVRLLNAYGIEAHTTDFEDYRPPDALDVISMADVLEHMPFPRVALYHAHDLLASDGLLFLSMPNADAFVWKVMTDNGINPYWGEIEHYHNFGRTRLYALLAECGFLPLHYCVSSRYRVGMEIIARRLPA